MLTLLTIPLASELSITSVASESETSSSSIIEIQYTKNNGYRITNGNKSAIDNITITLCDEEAADSFRQLTEERLSELAEQGSETAPEVSLGVSPPLGKRSLAVIDVSGATSDDEKYSTVGDKTAKFDGSTTATETSKLASNRKVAKNGSRRSTDAASSEPSTMLLPAATTPSNHVRHLEKSDSNQTPHQVTGGLPAPSFSSNKVAAESLVRSTPDLAKQAQALPHSKKTAKNSRKAHKQAVNIPATMAPSDGARPEEHVRSPTSAAAMAGLKKRSTDTAAAKRGRSQASETPLNQTPLNTDEYDLPLGDGEPTHPNKRAKTKTAKEPVKKTAAAESRNMGKGSMKSKGKQKTTESPDKGTQKTVATTRARRSAKTPSYVEDEDDSSDDGAKKDPTAQAPTKEPLSEDHAEDSYPLDKDAAEAVIRKANMSFKSHLKTLVASGAGEEPRGAQKAMVGTSHRLTTTPQRAIKPPREGSIPSVSEKVLRKTSIVHFGPQGPGNQAMPLAASATKPNAVSTSREVHAATTTSPMRVSLVDEELAITRAEHDHRPTHEARAEINAETNDTEDDDVAPPEDHVDRLDEMASDPRPPILEHQKEACVEVTKAKAKKVRTDENQPHTHVESAAVEEPELVMHEDMVESVAGNSTANGIIPVLEEQADSKSIEAARRGLSDQTDLQMQASDISDAETDERPSPVRSRASMEREVSEYVDSESSEGVVEDSIASADFQGQPHPNNRPRSPGPHTPAFDDLTPVNQRPRPKGSISYQDNNRRSIGVSTILDEEYPQSEKVINTQKIRSSLRPRFEEVSLHVGQHEVRADASLGRHAARSRGDDMDTWAETTITQAAGSKFRNENNTGTASERVNSMGPPPSRNTLSKPHLLANQSLMRSVPLKTNVQPSTTDKRNLDNVPRNHNPPTEEAKLPPHVPVRVKKTVPPLTAMPTSEIEVPLGTPLSFCTRWDMQADNAAEEATRTNGKGHVSESKNIVQNPGDASLTLINQEDSADAHRRATRLRRGRRLRSMSTDDMSSVMSPSQNEPLHLARKRQTTDLKVRDSQRGLLDVVMDITKVRLAAN